MYEYSAIEEQIDWGLGLQAASFLRGAHNLEQSSRFSNDGLPIGYLYRQAIELYLSSIVVILDSPRFEYEGPVRIERKDYDSKVKTHDLRRLLNYSRASLASKSPETLDNLNRLSDKIEQIYDLDPDGFYFRYPVKGASEKFEYSTLPDGSGLLFPDRLLDTLDLLRETADSLCAIYEDFRREFG